MYGIIILGLSLDPLYDQREETTGYNCDRKALDPLYSLALNVENARK